MITTEQLQESLFYPACGHDLKPLVFLGTRVQTFIYTDWNRSEASVVRDFTAESPEQGLTLVETKPIPPASYQPASIKVVCRNPRSRNYGQFIPADDEHPLPTQILPEGFSLAPEEECRYLDLKRAVVGVKEPWAREFHFQFNSAEGGRDLRVLYFSDEALARYCVTYLRQGLAPAMVCTTNSGFAFGCGWAAFEQPAGIFERFMEACPQRPKLWVREVLKCPENVESRWCVPVEHYPDWPATAFVREGDRVTQG